MDDDMNRDHLPVPPFFSNARAVPEVDPVDLEAVLQICGGGQPNPEDSRKASGSNVFEQACSPGADVFSVWYRAATLQLCVRLDLLSPWLHYGVLDEAVIKVAAKFPLQQMSHGVIRNSPPFDIKEFAKQVEAEARK